MLHRIAEVLGFKRNELPLYRDLALVTLCGFSLIYAGLNLLRAPISTYDLKEGLGWLLLGAICVLVSPNRRLVLAGGVGVIALLGFVGAILRLDAVAFLIAVVSSLIAVALLARYRKETTEKQ